MYRLRFYENGRFCTELGGPMVTVAIAARQLRAITSTIAGAVEMDKVLGVKWLRSGQTPCAILVVDEFGMTIANMEEEAKRIWEICSGDAEWEPYDHIDDFCWACSIYLEVDGFVFEGEGQTVSGGSRSIEYVDCTCPDGTVVRVA